MRTITAVFDGTAFVPSEPVDLAVGTTVRVPVPTAVAPGRENDPFPFASPPPTPMTAEEVKEWDELLAEIRSTSLPWATVEEAMAHSRGRPWPDPDAEAAPGPEPRP